MSTSPQSSLCGAALTRHGKLFNAIVDVCLVYGMDEDSLSLHLFSVQGLDPSYFYVPPLGSHYSLCWSTEDMLDEKMEGGKTKGLRPSTTNRDTGVSIALIY